MCNLTAARLTAAAASLVYGGVAHASPAVRTDAAVEIRDAAAITISADAPFRLLLSIGAPTVFSFAPSTQRLAAMIGDKDAFPVMLANTSGIIAATTGNGEVLSVSMDDQQSVGAIPSKGHEDDRFRMVVAQFN